MIFRNEHLRVKDIEEGQGNFEALIMTLNRLRLLSRFLFFPFAILFVWRNDSERNTDHPDSRRKTL